MPSRSATGRVLALFESTFHFVLTSLFTSDART